MTGSAAPVLLDGYEAKRCPVRTHNKFAPLIPVPEWVAPAELQALFAAGVQFEAEVFAALTAIHPDTAQLIDPDLRKGEAIATTLAAMESGVPLILGAWLPDDTSGGRKGKPDVLVKIGGGYLPADVKVHKTLDAAKRASKPVSSLVRPDIWWNAPGCTATSHHYDDGLQLAHYTRMLQACGFDPGPDRLFGAIIGTSTVAVSGPDRELVFVWHDLSKPTRPTFSRSRGKALRSVLERYGQEHDFRVKVAETAAQITGNADDPAPLVIPIGQKERGECPYELWCAEQMGPDDPSVAITRGRLDPREWQTLRRMGIGTTGALADLEPEDPALFDDYYPEVTHHSRDQALKRLQAAVRQAQMICDGVDFQPIPGTVVEVPSADIEIDFDIEWDTAGRISQWGLQVRDGQDDAIGFSWAVDGPGGRLSMTKIETARGGGSEALDARQWCLDYNESDVAAQAVIRDGIRNIFDTKDSVNPPARREPAKTGASPVTDLAEHQPQA